MVNVIINTENGVKIHWMNRLERIARFAEVIANLTDADPDLNLPKKLRWRYVSLIQNAMERDNGIFPYNTGNRVKRSDFMQYAGKSRFQKATATKAYEVLEKVSKDLTLGSCPTVEVALYVYYKARNSPKTGYHFDGLGESTFKKLERILKKMKIL